MNYLHRPRISGDMATSKTGSFWLTETIQQPAAHAADTPLTATIDLGAYVDVGDQQAIAVEQVDFIWQRQDAATLVLDVQLASALAADGGCGVQVCDLNPGTTSLLRADDNTLIASGALQTDTAGIVSQVDFFPDTFGKLDQARMVVNDQLFIITSNSQAVSAANLFVTVRIKARIVKLSTKDWMSIAIQSTAADN